MREPANASQQPTSFTALKCPILYRVMEDRQSSFTKDWLHRQHERLDAYFVSIEGMAGLRSQVYRRMSRTVIDQPARVGAMRFYRKREGLRTTRKDLSQG